MQKLTFYLVVLNIVFISAGQKSADGCYICLTRATDHDGSLMMGSSLKNLSTVGEKCYIINLLSQMLYFK